VRVQPIIASADLPVKQQEEHSSTEERHWYYVE